MLTKEQLQQRQNGLGGSDIASILNLSPFKTPLDIYIEKTSPIDGIEQSNSQYFGSLLEDVIRSEYARRMGVIISEPEIKFHNEKSFAFANIDGLVNDEYILECKTSHFSKAHEWGEEFTDQIPLYYLTQVAWYCFVYDLDRADIAVLIGGNDFRIYHYHRNKHLENKIVNRAEQFWYNNIVNKTPPDPREYSDLAKLYTNPQETEIVATEDIVKKIDVIRNIEEQINKLEKQKQQYKIDVMNYIGENSYLKDPLGNQIATWKKAKARKEFDKESFKEKNKSLYNKYLKEKNGTRRFLIKRTHYETTN